MITSTSPIAIFDSGIGGASIWQAIARHLPDQSTIYLADQAHVPYGERKEDEIRAICRKVTEFFIQQGAGLIVLACNSASAAALTELRTTFPDIRFVGMEPAIKPALAQADGGTVAVLATPMTLASQRFSRLVAQYDTDGQVRPVPCPGLAEAIERKLGDPSTTSSDNNELLLRLFKTLDGQAPAAAVLGCTHYTFLRCEIESALTQCFGSPIPIFDPAEAIARQVTRLLPDGSKAGSAPTHTFLTTGSCTNRFRRQIGHLHPTPHHLLQLRHESQGLVLQSTQDFL